MQVTHGGALYIPKLHRYLVQSRHGIYYLRIIRNGIEKRRSLRTRNPIEALAAAYQFGTEVMAGKIEKGWEIKVGSDALEIKTDGTQQDHDNAMKALELALRSGYQQQKDRDPVADEVAQNIIKELKIGLLVSQSIDNFFKSREHQISQGSIRTYRTPLNFLKEKIGHLPVSSIKPNQMDELTSNITKTLALKTIKNYTRTWKLFFEHLRERGEIATNPVILPVFGKSIVKQMASRNRTRRAYPHGDLEKLFNADQLNSYKKPDLLWLPLLALFSGARLETLCRLKTDDFQEYEPGRWSLHLKHDKEGNPRTIPVHQKLIDLGLLDYLQDIKTKAGSGFIFPHLTAVGGRFGHAPSKELGEVRKTLEIQPGSDFHAFRTTLISCLQFNGCPAEHRKIFVGHEPGEDVHEAHYSKAEFTPQRLADLIFPFLDYKKWANFELPDWKYEPGRFDGYLEWSLKQKSRREARKQRIAERE